MALSPKQINLYLMLKLPSAFLCGVRVKAISETACVVAVKHRWINQNPFRSMYFAVQAMAAELATGVLVLSEIKKTGKNVSMLVGSNRASFSKKATGRITFTCNDGQSVSRAIRDAIDTGTGQAILLRSIGRNEAGETVSEMDFEWNVKVKPPLSPSLNLP